MNRQTKPDLKRSANKINASESSAAAGTMALAALGWILSEDERAARFLALTGIDPNDLRTRIDDPVLHAAVIGFLTGHEADLIACASAIGERPEDVAACADALGL